MYVLTKVGGMYSRIQDFKCFHVYCMLRVVYNSFFNSAWATNILCNAIIWGTQICGLCCPLMDDVDQGNSQKERPTLHISYKVIFIERFRLLKMYILVVEVVALMAAAAVLEEVWPFT